MKAENHLHRAMFGGMIGIVFALCMLLFMPKSAFADAHAEYDPSTQTLTFEYSSTYTPAYGSNVTSSVAYYEPTSGHYFIQVQPDAPSSYVNWHNNVTAPTGLVGYTPESVTSIVIDPSFHQVQPANTYMWFDNMFNVGSITGLENFDMSRNTNMAHMFSTVGTTSDHPLTSLSGMENWDTSHVTSMENMFSTDTNLQTVGNISGWNVSNVTNMQSMFDTCLNLQNVNMTGWDVSNVTTMQRMFYNAVKLANVEGIGGWDVSSLQSIYEMFMNTAADPAYGAGMEHAALTSLDLSGWGSTTHNLQYIGGAFYGQDRLTDLNLSGWDTSSLSDMSSAFQYMYGLVNQPTGIDAWDTSALQNAASAFQGDSALQEISLPNWNTSAVTNLNSIFSGDTALTHADLTGWNTHNATDLGNMFGDESTTSTLDSNMSEIDLGTGWSFKGAATSSANWAKLPTPPTSAYYTGLWAMDDTFAPASDTHTPDELQDYDPYASAAHAWYWAGDGVTLTLDYDPNGGVGAPDAQTSDPAFVADDPSQDFTVSDVQPTRDGYTFEGWNTEADGSGDDVSAGDTLTLDADTPEVTLYAQWQEIPTPPTPGTDTGNNGAGGNESPAASPEGAAPAPGSPIYQLLVNLGVISPDAGNGDNGAEPNALAETSDFAGDIAGVTLAVSALAISVAAMARRKQD